MSIRARLLLIALLATAIPALAGQDREAAIADAAPAHPPATTQLQFGLARAADLDSDRPCRLLGLPVRGARGLSAVHRHPDHPPRRPAVLRFAAQRPRTGPQRPRLLPPCARTRGEAVVLEPTFGRLTGRAVMQVAYPVRTAGWRAALRAAGLAGSRALPCGRQPPVVPDTRACCWSSTTRARCWWSSPAIGRPASGRAARSPARRWAFCIGRRAKPHHRRGDARRRRVHVWARADTSGAGARPGARAGRCATRGHRRWRPTARYRRETRRARCVAFAAACSWRPVGWRNGRSGGRSRA
jgi:hypothetical protein